MEQLSMKGIPGRTEPNNTKDNEANADEIPF
jgi:hypothetical protein